MKNRRNMWQFILFALFLILACAHAGAPFPFLDPSQEDCGRANASQSACIQNCCYWCPSADTCISPRESVPGCDVIERSLQASCTRIRVIDGFAWLGVATLAAIGLILLAVVVFLCFCCLRGFLRCICCFGKKNKRSSWEEMKEDA